MMCPVLKYPTFLTIIADTLLFLFVSISVYIHVPVHVYVPVPVPVPVSMSMFVSMLMCIFCVYFFAHVCFCVCVCICVRVYNCCNTTQYFRFVVLNNLIAQRAFYYIVVQCSAVQCSITLT